MCVTLFSLSHLLVTETLKFTGSVIYGLGQKATFVPSGVYRLHVVVCVCARVLCLFLLPHTHIHTHTGICACPPPSNNIPSFIFITIIRSH